LTEERGSMKNSVDVEDSFNFEAFEDQKDELDSKGDI